MNRIERIAEMERCLDASREALDALEKAFLEYEAVQKDYRRLCGYYSSARWMEDLGQPRSCRQNAENHLGCHGMQHAVREVVRKSVS